MAKIKSKEVQSDSRERDQAQDPLKEGRIEYFEKFSGTSSILQNDGTTILFHNWRATYPVREGDVVNYRLELGPLGWRAVDITKKP